MSILNQTVCCLGYNFLYPDGSPTPAAQRFSLALFSSVKQVVRTH